MLDDKKTKWLVPGEWEAHKALFLAWPYDTVTFPHRVEKAQALYVQIIKAVYLTEEVHVLVSDEHTEQLVVSMAEAVGIDIRNIIFHITLYADVWVRDYGPTFVKDIETGKKAWIKWQYNAYGAKFPELLKDNDVFYDLQKTLSVPMIDARVVMEGGAIEVNGKGTLLTTEQCLLNPNRNPGLSKEQTEKYLTTYTGASQIIWLKNGITNDHTDGHIDEVARFVDSTTIVCGFENDANHVNFPILNDAYATLVDATDQDGNPFTVVKLPMPHINYDDGTFAPASYTNFYIGNGIVLVPQFNDPNDALALKILSDLFPTRKTIGIDCSDLIYGGGTIHCITAQEPK